ncbi:MAG: DUF692 family protein [Gammaproteobacteria bacterium]
MRCWLKPTARLLLDVNNIYVNSVNHDYDAPYEGSLRQIPGERIAYIHVAGHYREAPDLLVTIPMALT